MRGILGVEDFDCNGGDRPPLETIEKRKPRPNPRREGDRVLVMELDAMGTSIHIPVPQQAQGKHVRITVEVLK